MSGAGLPLIRPPWMRTACGHSRSQVASDQIIAAPSIGKARKPAARPSGAEVSRVAAAATARVHAGDT
eukprot:1155028-Pyramimonas_sp.AAC.1